MPVWTPRKIDDERWISQKVTLSGTPSLADEVTIAYIDCPAPSSESKGTVLLIHGFPQTAYQFRHVITPISNAGYRVVAPDYRGAGHSSHPRNGYTKTVMATDLHTLLVDHLKIIEPVHVVGHDIGGMIAHAYAVLFPKDSRSVTWGECPLPGTTTYDTFAGTVGTWHFVFHWQNDLPEQLVHGRERLYMKHFFDRLSKNPNAISPADIDHYVSTYAQPGAMRCGFDVYRAFHEDVKENRELFKKNGPCPVPAQTLNGEGSFLAGIALEMVKEMYTTASSATVEKAGHWCAEENPEDFIKKVLDFISKL